MSQLCDSVNAKFMLTFYGYPIVISLLNVLSVLCGTGTCVSDVYYRQLIATTLLKKYYFIPFSSFFPCSLCTFPMSLWVFKEGV